MPANAVSALPGAGGAALSDVRSSRSSRGMANVLKMSSASSVCSYNLVQLQHQATIREMPA